MEEERGGGKRERERERGEEGRGEREGGRKRRRERKGVGEGGRERDYCHFQTTLNFSSSALSSSILPLVCSSDRATALASPS